MYTFLATLLCLLNGEVLLALALPSLILLLSVEKTRLCPAAVKGQKSLADPWNLAGMACVLSLAMTFIAMLFLLAMHVVLGLMMRLLALKAKPSWAASLANRPASSAPLMVSLMSSTSDRMLSMRLLHGVW